MDKSLLEQIELEILDSGVWGTIAPHSISAAKALAERLGGKHGLLCHSADAAYEALLRHLGARFAELPHGDAVIVGAVSAPSDSLVALCVGAEPIFCPVCETCGMISPKALTSLLDGVDKPIRAIVIDYLPAQGDRYPLDVIAELCHKHRIPLVLNLGGDIGAMHQGKPLPSLADAVICSLGKGSAVDAGGGGLVVTDNESLWAGTFAYHNCGRSFGAGCSLVMDNIVGGDMRVTEWIAAAAEEILSQDALVTPAPRMLVQMEGQPVFDSTYARKACTYGKRN